MRRILLIAFNFPPWSASTGHLRILNFCRHLPRHGWEPLVLTVHPRAYAASWMPLVDEPTNGIRVYRAFGLDAQVHMSLRGKYPSWLALPDRWSTWWLGGVWTGMGIMRRWKPDVVFSTYPITTAHLIGFTISRAFGVPWVADFRDPIIDGRYPDDTIERKVRRWVERITMRNCSAAVFTTGGALREYAERYPEVSPEQLNLLPNGYDETVFDEVEATLTEQAKEQSTSVTIVHSGALYPDLRDPRSLFVALRQLRAEGHIDGGQLTIVFRGSGDDAYYAGLARDAEIDDLVRFEPGFSYREAVREMITADGLLVMQGSSANQQIPAKVYEYLRAGTPILALTDRAGDTAGFLEEAGIRSVAQIDDVASIKSTLRAFIASVRSNTWKSVEPDFVASCSRSSGAEKLARLIDSMM